MASTNPSLLVNIQTSEQIDSQPTYGQALRHPFRRQYAAALRIYSILDSSSDESKARRLSECRANAWFTRHVETGEVRVASSACSLRWCPVCANARRNYVSHEIAEWLCSANHPKLITLTLKHTSAPLNHQIEHLYKYFRDLRRRKEIKKAITGGVWFFQIKKSKDDGLWHPHIHALVTGLYFPRRRLSRIWSEITYGSFVTDIRPIYDPRAVANDVARYATSPGSLVDLPPDDALELVESLHGRRICGTWGTARGISLRPKFDCEKGKWESIGRWSTVLAMSPDNHNAQAILFSWKTGIPLGQGISCSIVDNKIDRIGTDAWAGYDFESIFDHEGDPP